MSLSYRPTLSFFCLFFFFTDPATTEISTFPYTTLFRSRRGVRARRSARGGEPVGRLAGQDRPQADQPPGLRGTQAPVGDRKSTRLNSSHMSISYAVFCLKKKKKKQNDQEEDERNL